VEVKEQPVPGNFQLYIVYSSLGNRQEAFIFLHQLPEERNLNFYLVAPSPERPPTRSRSKTPVISNERPPIPKKAKKIPSEPSTTEAASIPTNNKRKNPTSTIKKGKRRLHSVEQDEGLNTADEEETIQTISPPIEVKSIDLSQEEREKVNN
jgi:hypothetical protein